MLTSVIILLMQRLDVILDPDVCFPFLQSKFRIFDPLISGIFVATHHPDTNRVSLWEVPHVAHTSLMGDCFHSLAFGTNHTLHHRREIGRRFEMNLGVPCIDRGVKLARVRNRNLLSHRRDERSSHYNNVGRVGVREWCDWTLDLQVFKFFFQNIYSTVLYIFMNVYVIERMIAL